MSMSAPPSAASRNALVLGDVLRPDPGVVRMNQRINIECLATLLRAPLAAIGVKLEGIGGHLGPDEFRQFLTRFYAAFDLPPTLESWAAVYRREAPGAEAFGPLVHLVQDTLVIGFELPPIVQSLLTRVGATYIDVRLHPLRCLPDLLYGVSSNSPSVRRRISKWGMSHSFAAGHLALLKSRHARFGRAQDLDGSLLFLAQVRGDSALIGDAGFYADEDVVRGVEDIRGGRRLWIKPHPLDAYNPTIQKLLDAVADAEVWNGNFYTAACVTEGVEFISVSSSASYEAAALGNKARVLSKYAALPSQPAPEEYTPILFEYRLPEFWADVLFGDTDGAAATTHQPSATFVPNALRSSLYASWDYDKPSIG